MYRVYHEGNLKDCTEGNHGLLSIEDKKFIDNLRNGGSNEIKLNYLYNTSFERWGLGTRELLFWSGGTCVKLPQGVSYGMDQYSNCVMLSSYQSIENVIDYRPDPIVYGGGQCGFYIRTYGGACQLQIFDSSNWTTIPLILSS